MGSVDLIYLDPPFQSNRDYNAIYKDETGRPLPDQIEAFCDTWILDSERARVIRAMPVLMRESGLDDSVVEFWRLWMNALRQTQPSLLAYLSYMVERLLQMKSILKPTGSIYLHCDPTASHYIKIMMDSIFGHQNFRNEIVWYYGQRTAFLKRHFSKKHDVILFYGKSKSATLNKVALPWDKADFMAHRHDVKIDEEGNEYIWSDGGARGKRYKRMVDDVISAGKPMDSVWSIPIINSAAKERMGYATQKPLALLDRIIRASSNPGDVVFDPFCGCATTLEAAHALGRKWIGIDIAIHAVKRVARMRLQHRLDLKEGEDFIVDGVPRNLEGAKDLWEKDKYHFQKWAVEEVEGFVTTKRTADGGIDGRIYFPIHGEEDLQSMVIEVKGGKNVNISDLRALKGVLDNDTALMAGLIIMEPLGERKDRNFRAFMADAGDLIVNRIEYPRMQMLSIPEIFEGKRFYTPGVVGKGQKEQITLPGSLRRDS
ncbi:MAG: site-specific DNA-methyltransferase [Nitrospinae bacterium]|nr:site-specific DNA-methyltransferase [Nitrospinota bacterium]